MTGAGDVLALARAVRDGTVRALDLAQASLSAVEAKDRLINSFTAITRERALREAEAIDAARARGETLPPLAGVPYAVKNLFDVAGLTTLAGAKIFADNPPAAGDAVLVQRLQKAGAVLIGALNMDAYAYGFTTENSHYGTTRNPRDSTRLSGGSSGGSGAAVAAGFVAFSMASDTNGSIRVPSSLCGVFGLKPTYGRLPRRGSFPFVHSLDHLGPLARSVADLAQVYDVLQGADADDPACAVRPVEPVLPELDKGVGGLRIGVLGGYFEACADSDARAVVAQAAQALGADSTVSLADADAARAAAFLITASEGGTLHLDDLRRRAAEFEPLSRDRLIAGALLPAAWYVHAQRFRARFLEQARRLFQDYDVLIAPATPCSAPMIGTPMLTLDNRQLPLRPNLGLLTQPISFIGLPVCAAPLWTSSGLPLAVQLIAAPWREDLCLRAAHALEQADIARAPVAPGYQA